MTYGSGRLVATRAAPNIPFKFDGLQLIDAVGGGKIYAFITKPAREHEYTFDDEYPDQLFWGAYGTTPVLVCTEHRTQDRPVLLGISKRPSQLRERQRG